MSGIRTEMRGELQVDYVPQVGSLLAVHGNKHYNLIKELMSYNGQQVKITVEKLRPLTDAEVKYR